MIATAIASDTITIATRSNQRIIAGLNAATPAWSAWRRRRSSAGPAWCRCGGRSRRLRGGLDELGDRVDQILRQQLDVSERVVIGVQPEVQLAVVAHDRNP